jgi:hypothetical protein
LAQSWTAFAGDAERLVRIAPVVGLEAGAAAFRALVEGSAKPDIGTVVHLAN